MNYRTSNQLQLSLEKTIFSAQESNFNAKKYPLDSLERQKAIFQRNLALTELVKQLEWLLKRNSKHGFFEEIYHLAIQELWLEICQEIERYDPKLASVGESVSVKMPHNLMQNSFYIAIVKLLYQNSSLGIRLELSFLKTNLEYFYTLLL
jgi:hypothetical protein